jgi:hypothetical protein
MYGFGILAIADNDTTSQDAVHERRAEHLQIAIAS